MSEKAIENPIVWVDCEVRTKLLVPGEFGAEAPAQ